jgi:diguanylate cyclase (GGDEF)-like protein/PAS domain S-box-containing protein
MSAAHRTDSSNRCLDNGAGRIADHRYRILFERSPNAVALLDLDARVIRVNQAFCRLFNYTEAACVGRRMADLIVPEHLKAESRSIFARAQRGDGLQVETRRLRSGGTPVEVCILATPIDLETGQPALHVIYQDISDRRATDARLRRVAFHDGLTGLPNRKSFNDQLENCLRNANRRKSDRNWALMFLDLDKFKRVNDTLGHDMGDRLLKAVAKRIKRCLRGSDHLFRLGGDEFTVIVTDLNRAIDVARVAAKLIDVVARPFRINGQEIFTAASIGISVCPADGWDAASLVKNADMAMYAAKSAGGGAYRFFTEEMNRKAQQRLKMEISLRKALDREELVLYYQSLVNDARRIVGMEALLRWRHPKMGLLLPADFIRITEETGMIVSIGQWVLQQACTQARCWHAMGFPDLFVAVNLSARQLVEPDFEQMVSNVLKKSGLPPERLKLEVSESSVIQNPDVCITKMKRMREIGIAFAIDDFGAGYASLSYLKRFPVDTLKIDRSFIAEAMNSRGDREIIKTIIAMARNLNIATVAEGVETVAQHDFLSSHGCDRMQGFLFAHPVPVDQFNQLLERQRSTAPSAPPA